MIKHTRANTAFGVQFGGSLRAEQGFALESATMPYRVCKSFEVESGHMLSKHPSLCRYLHGHSRTVSVVLVAETLDAHDMVCDFKAVKLALRDHLERLDHSMAMNSNDPTLAAMKSGPLGERVVVFDNVDPTTEIFAKHIFDILAHELRAGKTYHDDRGVAYRFPAGLRLERVRVSETSSTWAEYGE